MIDNVAGRARNIYSVSGFSSEVRQLLETSYAELWIEGEISSLSSPASGHSYFALKDDKAQVRCALFRQRKVRCAVAPREGLKVLLRARVSLYEARGDFQLIVDYMEDAGEGALRRAMEALKRQLAAEGLFNEQHKLAIPERPRSVGVISSASGAALRDILITLRRTAPWLPVIIYPVTVQGNSAPASIVAALECAASRNECDVLILARGGGSLEDLMAFNDESVVRAVFACPLPVISGVGHETDTTLVDLVADFRAATPTAAAQRLGGATERLNALATSSESRLIRGIENGLHRSMQGVDRLCGRIRHPLERIRHQLARIEHARMRLVSNASGALAGAGRGVDALQSRLRGHSPTRALVATRRDITEKQGRLQSLLASSLNTRRARLDAIARQLENLGPEHTLARGYAILVDATSGTLINRIDLAREQQTLNATLSDGTLDLTVSGKRSR